MCVVLCYYNTELALPKNCCLEFTKPKLKNKYHQVELRFSAKFSNILIVHVVCDRNLQPEVVMCYQLP